MIMQIPIDNGGHNKRERLALSKMGKALSRMEESLLSMGEMFRSDD